MVEFLDWFARHPFYSEETNVLFWISVVGVVLVGVVIKFGKY